MVISPRPPTGEGGSNYLQYFTLRGFIFKSRFVPYRKDDRFEVFKNFKVGANGSKVGLKTLKLPLEVIKTLGASI